MKKHILRLVLFVMLLSLCACGANRDIEKDSNGRIIKETIYDKTGKISEEITYTYHESGATHTKTTVYPQVTDPYTFTKIKFEYSEDGLSAHEFRYYDEDRLYEDIYWELYANEEENWHKEFDQTNWHLHGIITYFKDGEISHSENEYLENHTYAQRIYSPEGIIQEEQIYEWCEEHKVWDILIKTRFYDSEGNLIDEIIHE